MVTKKEIDDIKGAILDKDEKGLKKKKEKSFELTDLPGIGPAVSAKLENAGVFDMMSLAVMSPASLSDAAGVSSAVARKAIQAARNILELGFIDGSEFAKKRKDVIKITTGSHNFDELLGGKGIESKAITEAFGAYGSGKTQLGLSLAVNVQLPLEQGGAEGKVAYIDTEGTFRPDRIKQIAEGVGANPEMILKNVLVARAFNSDHQILLLEKVSDLIKSGEPIKLIIIDSLTAHFRAEFAGRGQLADRQQKLNRYMHELMKVAETHNLAVYVTNQVMANPAQLFGDPTSPIGGNIVGHACLTGESLVQIGDGSIKEIRQMSGEKVFSGNFKNLKFERRYSDTKFVNPDVKEIYDIQTTNKIRCSPLHRFFSVENFGIVEKEARELRNGDFLMQAGKIEVVGEEQNLPLVGIKKIGRINQEEGGKVIRELRRNNVTRQEICKRVGITPRQFRRVLNESSSTNLEVFNQLGSYFSGNLQLEVEQVYTNKYQNLVMPRIMNESLAQICGYFIGDGNFEDRSLRFRDERKEVLEKYNSLFKSQFGKEGKISKIKDKNCYNLDFNSKEIKEFFMLIMPEIFNYVGKSKNDVVRGFIRGFFDAEGHINKKRNIISVSQKEKQILKYLQLFLLRFGTRSFLREDVGFKKISNLSIRDRSVKDFLKIGFSAGDKQKRLFECVKNINSTYDKEMMPVLRRDLKELLLGVGLKPFSFIKSRPLSYKFVNRRELQKAFGALMKVRISDRQVKQKINFIFDLLNSDFRFEKIRKINVSRNSGELFYDFSVPNGENYVANGFVVHNSTYRLYLRRAKQGSRVAKLIDSPDLPDGEAIYYVTNHGVKDSA